MIEKLLSAWIDAKNEEILANKKRVSIEADIYTALNLEQTKAKCHEAGDMKLTVTYPERETWDHEALSEYQNLYDFPFKMQFKPDRKALKKLEKENRGLWLKIMDHCTTKPGKPGFTVVRKNSSDS